MSCCGKQRERFHRASGVHSKPTAPESAARTVRYTSVYFEYLGKTGMTVLGPVSGKRYRFDHSGAKVEVDLRDRASLAAISALRQVQGF
ncbi:hypothetical protein HUU05_04765 [candidate division KSB1 bacterium]|nr:hypothetical protein [candidate division KSB1 bacterium]